MKKTKIAFAIAATAIATGCTSLKIGSDGSGKYSSGSKKQFSEMSYSKSGSNIVLTVKGYKAASATADMVQGLEIIQKAYTGQPVKP